MTMHAAIRLLTVSGLAVLSLVLGFATADAQGYPNRPIRLYQGFPAGGTADVVARALGEEIASTLGQPVVTEAKPGASGNIATEQVVRSAPDGHALVLFTTAHLISPALMKSISFDATKDLDYVSMVAELSFFVAVHNDSPFKTIDELIAHARSNPDTLTWGSAGTGSGQHMCGELLAHTTGVKLRHVPFRGDAGSVTALLSRSIDFIVAPSPVLVGNIHGGNFRALAVAGKKRAPALPDVPTLSEALSIDIDMMFPQGIATTKGTPPSVIEQLRKAVHGAIASPTVQKRLGDMGAVALPTTPAQTATIVGEQIALWRRVVAAAGLKHE
jgi:tripartite-type tricarboxylate transporter receptor subunit TctC